MTPTQDPGVSGDVITTTYEHADLGWLTVEGTSEEVTLVLQGDEEVFLTDAGYDEARQALADEAEKRSRADEPVIEAYESLLRRSA